MIDIDDDRRQRTGLQFRSYFSSERQRLVLIGLCLLIGILGAYVGPGLRDASTWIDLLGKVALVVAGFVAVAALMRFFEALSLRRELAAQAARSTRVSETIRKHLGALDPGVEERAARIDAERLVAHALSTPRRGEPDQTTRSEDRV